LAPPRLATELRASERVARAGRLFFHTHWIHDWIRECQP
jgi:hypothetical protein